MGLAHDAFLFVKDPWDFWVGWWAACRKAEDITGSRGDMFEWSAGPFRLSPFDSIFLSIIPPCLPALMRHLKQLKVIYQTHECCIKEACAAGYNTKSCDHAFDKAICQYTFGGLARAVINAVIGAAITWIVNKLLMLIKTKIVDKLKKWGFVVYCLMGLALGIYALQEEVRSVIQAWQEFLDDPFKSPNFKDLWFNIEKAAPPTAQEIGRIKVSAGELKMIADNARYSPKYKSMIAELGNKTLPIQVVEDRIVIGTQEGRKIVVLDAGFWDVANAVNIFINSYPVKRGAA